MNAMAPDDRVLVHHDEQSDKISHIDAVIFHIDTVSFHIDTAILGSSSISILSFCHLVDRMTRSYLVTPIMSKRSDDPGPWTGETGVEEEADEVEEEEVNGLR